jgi:hypothetical protein
MKLRIEKMKYFTKIIKIGMRPLMVRNLKNTKIPVSNKGISSL